MPWFTGNMMRNPRRIRDLDIYPDRVEVSNLADYGVGSRWPRSAAACHAAAMRR